MQMNTRNTPAMKGLLSDPKPSTAKLRPTLVRAPVGIFAIYVLTDNGLNTVVDKRGAFDIAECLSDIHNLQTNLPYLTVFGIYISSGWFVPGVGGAVVDLCLIIDNTVPEVPQWGMPILASTTLDGEGIRAMPLPEL